MPTVPTYDSQVSPGSPSVGRFGTPDFTNYAPRQMQELGGAMQKAAGEVGKIADQLQLETDEAFIKEKDNQFAETLRKLLHDPDGGYLNTLGKDAVGGRDGTIEAVNKARQIIEQDIRTPQQRAMWQGVADRRVQSGLGMIDTHASQQVKVYREGQTVARIKTGVDDAVANWAGGDAPGGLYSTARSTTLAEVDELAKLRGYSPEQAQQLRQETLTGMHGSVIGNMISLGATKQAQAYLDKNIKEIDPEKVDDFRKLVEQSNLKDRSLELSMTIKGGLSQQRKTLDEMFTRGEINAEMRDATLTRMEHNYSIQKAQQAEWEKSLIGQAQDYLIKNPNATVQDLPPQMYRSLVSTGHIGTIAGFARSGRFDTDPRVWAEISSMSQSELAKMTPAEFFNRYRGKLDDAHLEKGYALVNGARGEAKDPQHLDIISTNDRMKGAAVQLGILDATGKPSDDQATAYFAFQQNIEKRVTAFERNNLGGKRKATDEELQLIIDGVAMDRVFRTTWTGKQVAEPIATMDTDNLANAYVVVGGERIPVARINPSMRATIVDKLMSRGLPVTEQAIAELWVKAGKPN